MSLSNSNPRRDKLSFILLTNVLKGKVGEQIAKEDYIHNGFKIIRTGKGSDFIALKELSESDEPYTEFVEVKTGKSRQSKKQRKTMREIRRMGKNYRIYRVTDSFLTSYIKSKPGMYERRRLT